MEEITIGIKLGLIAWVIISISETLLNKINKTPPTWWCNKCATWWIILAITFNPFTAATAAFFIWWVEKNNKIEL
jgi:hypothetical protein